MNDPRRAERRPPDDAAPRRALRTVSIPPDVGWPTPDQIAAALREAERQRAWRVRRAVRAAGARLRRLAGAAADPPDALARLSDSLRAPLTSIRSSAEILRDHPEITPQERRRFLENLLEAERRMEGAVAELMRHARAEKRGGVRIEMRPPAG